MGKPKLIQRHENLQPPTGKRTGKPIIVQKHELKRSRPSIVDEEYIESQMNSILQKLARNSYMKAVYNDGDIECMVSSFEDIQKEEGRRKEAKFE